MAFKFAEQNVATGWTEVTATRRFSGIGGVLIETAGLLECKDRSGETKLLPVVVGYNPISPIEIIIGGSGTAAGIWVLV